MAAVASVSAESHNRVLEAAQRRVDRLEGRLASVVEPILARAGEEAARRFRAYATNHLTAAAANDDVPSSATMVCVRPRPEEADAIADPDGDAPELLHVTLAYLGETDAPLEEIADALRPVAATLAPLAGVVGGYGIFEPAGVGILLPDVPGLVELRVAVCEALLAGGIDYARSHGFEAHITVHSEPDAAAQEAALERASGEPLHFDAVVVVRGNSEEVALPLVGVPALTADAGLPPDWTAPFPDEVIDVDALVAEILAKTEPVREEMIRQTMTPALEQAGLAWDVTNPLTAQVLASSASQVTNIAKTTQLNVMRTIDRSYRNGLSIPQTSDVIREGMAVASKSRATMIARTELGRAVNGGSLAATRLVAGATGDQYDKTWMTAPGARYPRHEDYDGLDGQTTGLEGMFQVGDGELEYPGDPSGDPGETINCRCTMTYGTPEGEQTADSEDPPDFGDAAAALAAPLSALTGDDPAALASSLTSRAKAFEPALTKAMKASADESGAKLVGLDYRMKGEGSAERKIAEDSRVRQQTARQTAYEVADMVRYTAQFAEDQYVAGVKAMLSDLEKRGMRVGRFRNTWLPDAPYRGVNVQMIAPNGYKYELQFHTPSSWDLKSATNHPLYEEWRLLDPTDARAGEIERQMMANADTVAEPKGIKGFDYGDPGAQANIGVTPFRPEDDPIGFYDSAKFKDFTDRVYTTANDYGVVVERVENATGLWQGETEPSVSISAHDGELGLRAFAASLGRSYDQDGVLVFGKQAGGDQLATFLPASQDEAVAALQEVGLDGGRITADGRLQVVGSGVDFTRQLDRLTQILGPARVERGSFALLEGPADYSAAQTAYASG